MHVGHAVHAVIPDPIEIVPLTADQWADLKRLRITALTESPDSFSPTAESARAHDDDYWRGGAKRAEEAANFEMFIVRRNGDGLGLASAHRDDAGVGHIGAMWVDPVLRGQGVGARLFDTVVAHLRTLACATIELSVTETNAAAIALYQSRGFVLTGKFEPLREGSKLANLFMRWTAADASRAPDRTR
jgi:ribosomal protein S18 acetylase RimI-like enzyme